MKTPGGLLQLPSARRYREVSADDEPGTSPASVFTVLKRGKVASVTVPDKSKSLVPGV